MKQVIVVFSLLITALLVLFNVAGRYRLETDIYELWIIGLSLLFLAIGIVLSRKLFPRIITITKSASVSLDGEALKAKGLSKREVEILRLINNGLSNLQIADELYISEHTVKKHISNLFLKLNVERRTEAVRRAIELSI